jgi:hypothetical protein
LKPLKILGIYRNPRFSNNAIEADRMILEASLAHLQEQSTRPVIVEMLEEHEVELAKGPFDLVLTMAQSEDALTTLDTLLPTTQILNSQAAIRNCYRKTMSRILINSDVNYVPFQLISTDCASVEGLESGASYWLKRSDFHAISDEDVTFAESTAELEAKLAHFRKRNVAEVIVQKHIEGDIYKFYGVEGGLFRPFKVRKVLANSVTPDFAELERMARVSAEALDLMIYGGDAVLDNNGIFHLIDLNDWPSFRICRDDAAKAISALAQTHLRSTPETVRHITAIPAYRA